MAPGPLTLRELAEMAEGRDRNAWNHTAATIATLVNINRDPKKTAVPAQRFHPYEQPRTRDGIRITRGNIDLLKVFIPAGENP